MNSDKTDGYGDEMPDEGGMQRERQRAALESMLQRRLLESINARSQSGIEEIWQAAQDQYDGIDTAALQQGIEVLDKSRPFAAPQDQQRGRAGIRSRIVLNITEPKTDTAIARVSEMLLPVDDRAWEYQSTPVPDIDKAIESEDDSPVVLADGSTATAADAARALKALADEKAAAMQAQVEDWLIEGSVHAEMRKVIRQAGVIGTGALKGPVPVMRRDHKWTKLPDGRRALVVSERLAPTSVAVSVRNLFPDPACRDSIHDGSWLWEYDELSSKSLRELAKDPSYDKQAIAEILAEGPMRPHEYADRQAIQRAGQNARNGLPSTYQVWYYWGDIDAETLVSGDFVLQGMLDEADESDPDSMSRRYDQAAELIQLATVPVVATMVNGRIIKMAPNPLESGEFPFDLFPWQQIEGQVWGRGIPTKMAAAQRMLNAATRAMLENAGMAGGPQIVAMRDVITPANGNAELTGRKLWWADKEIEDVRKAFGVFLVEPIQQSFQAIIEFALAMADQLTNLPLLLQGAQGQAPDTVGGMAMLQANATSPLKAIAKMADDLLFIPHMTRYYRWGMQDPSVPDTCKGDMQASARAASVLAYRDFLANFLPQLLPFVKDPAFKIDPEKYIAELLRANRYSPEKVSLTPEQVKAIEAAQAQAPADPRVLAVQQKAEQHAADMEDREMERQWKAQEAAMDRALAKYTNDIQFQIQAMETANRKDISLQELRSMLAAKAIDTRTKRDLFVAERQFAINQGGGRGL